MRNGKWECNLCGKWEDERAIQEQIENVWLCLSCVDLYDDQELYEKITEIVDGRDEIHGQELSYLNAMKDSHIP